MKKIVLVLFLMFLLSNTLQVYAGNVLRDQTEEKTVYIQDYQALIKYINDCLMEQQSILIGYYGNGFQYVGKQQIDEMIRQAIRMDDGSTVMDAASLWGNIKSYKITLGTTAEYSLIDIDVKYRHTVKEMKSLENAVKDILLYLQEKEKIMELPDENKIKVIHDFLCAYFDYDYTYTNDDYGGIYYKIAEKNVMICQGYSLLSYKLLNPLGVETKIIVSKTHSWNLVKLYGKWYHLDVTNDDIGGSKISYNNFLKAELNGREYDYLKETLFYAPLNIKFSKNDFPVEFDKQFTYFTSFKRFAFNFIMTVKYMLNYSFEMQISLICIIFGLTFFEAVKRKYKNKIRRKNKLFEIYKIS